MELNCEISGLLLRLCSYIAQCICLDGITRILLRYDVEVRYILDITVCATDLEFERNQEQSHMMTFRQWAQEMWYQHQAELESYGLPVPQYSSEYFRKFKYWLRNEYRYQQKNNLL